MNSSIAPQYLDIGRPSQGGSDKYSSLAGFTECSQKCQSTYANPMLDSSCPSYCNFYDSYSTVKNIYSPNTIYIPPNSAARIYNYPIGVNADYMVTQPQIVNWSGKLQSNNLSGQPLSMNSDSLMNKLTSNLASMKAKLSELVDIQSQVKKAAQDFVLANNIQKGVLSTGVTRLAERSKALNSDIANMNNDNITTAVNIAPFTVRNDAQNAAVVNARENSQRIAKDAQAINNQIILLNDLGSQRAMQAGPAQSDNLGAESFRYNRRGNFGKNWSVM
jgi:hypothetical protein